LNDYACERRDASQASAQSPVPSNKSVDASGVGTLAPGCVPKENTTLLTVTFDGALNVKTALWFTNGLCGPLPSIEEFAVE